MCLNDRRHRSTTAGRKGTGGVVSSTVFLGEGPDTEGIVVRSTLSVPRCGRRVQEGWGSRRQRLSSFLGRFQKSVVSVPISTYQVEPGPWNDGRDLPPLGPEFSHCSCVRSLWFSRRKDYQYLSLSPVGKYGSGDMGYT